MMRLPTIQGIIRRRLLINFRVEPDIIQRQLPAIFRPKLQAEKAIAGICLIRLEQIRPKGMPSFLGLYSENAAHRIAVLWDDKDGTTHEGVFVPRRDTDSKLNHLLGGRLFPGEQNQAVFSVRESDDEIELEMESQDKSVKVKVKGKTTDQTPKSSVFSSLPEVSSFFEHGSLGYSVTNNPERFDGIVLHTEQWRVEALDVSSVSSSYFDDETKFPKGSVAFDNGLIMRNIEHEWHSAEDLHT